MVVLPPLQIVALLPALLPGIGLTVIVTVLVEEQPVAVIFSTNV